MRVFVNFRPEITDAAIVDRFKACFRASKIFDDIVLSPVGQAPSADYPARAISAVAQCDAFIAIVRPGWADLRGPRGRLIDDPLDPIRAEIIAALDRIMPMVPVLMDGATFPDPAEMARDLQALALREPVELRLASLDREFPRLLASIVPGFVDTTAGRSGSQPSGRARNVSKPSPAATPSEVKANKAPGLARRLWGRRPVAPEKAEVPTRQTSVAPTPVPGQSPQTSLDPAPPSVQEPLKPIQVPTQATVTPSKAPVVPAPSTLVQVPPVPVHLVQRPQVQEPLARVPIQPPPVPSQVSPAVVQGPAKPLQPPPSQRPPARLPSTLVEVVPLSSAPPVVVPTQERVLASVQPSPAPTPAPAPSPPFQPPLTSVQPSLSLEQVPPAAPVQIQADTIQSAPASERPPSPLSSTLVEAVPLSPVPPRVRLAHEHGIESLQPPSTRAQPPIGIDQAPPASQVLDETGSPSQAPEPPPSRLPSAMVGAVSLSLVPSEALSAHEPLPPAPPAPAQPPSAPAQPSLGSDQAPPASQASEDTRSPSQASEQPPARPPSTLIWAAPLSLVPSEILPAHELVAPAPVQPPTIEVKQPLGADQTPSAVQGPEGPVSPPPALDRPAASLPSMLVEAPPVLSAPPEMLPVHEHLPPPAPVPLPATSIQPPIGFEKTTPAAQGPVSPPSASQLPAARLPSTLADWAPVSPAIPKELPPPEPAAARETVETSTSNQITAEGATAPERQPESDPPKATKDKTVRERQPVVAFSKHAKQVRVSAARIVRRLDARTRQIYARGQLRRADQRPSKVVTRAAPNPTKAAENPSSDVTPATGRSALVPGAVVFVLVVLAALAGWVVFDFVTTQLASWRGLFASHF